MTNHVTEGAQISWLSDGRRLHFHHGPIDLVVEVQGSKAAVQVAVQHAASVFVNVLPDLVSELELLRSPIVSEAPAPKGAVARLMFEAANRHAAKHFVTPMISVAGSVADYMLQSLTDGFQLSRAYVNNGGDIALFLSEGQSYDTGICDSYSMAELNSTLRLDAASGIRGIATSGWRGRSHSLGIADEVTVLARDAASADAAATLIANAVNVPESSNVTRRPASELSPDSDLADLPVTVAVDPLCYADVTQALQNGANVALHMLQHGLIDGVLIVLQGRTRMLGSVCRVQLASA